MILSASLIMALSASLVAVRQKRLVLSTDDSNYAYQRAEIGVERLMVEVLEDKNASVNDIFSSACDGDSKLIEMSDPVVKVEFLGEDGDEFVQIDCDSTTDTAGDIVRLKAVGIYRRTQRAIEAPVVWPTP
ncbi:MAG: hypothetical protein QG620_594 [Patescibacteria group bacterium]|nr:hypothetical protein [Patescibacteria group bacterium]